MNKKVRNTPARRRPLKLVEKKEESLKQSHLITIYGVVIALVIVVTVFTTT